DPYSLEPGVDSANNWSADTHDDVNTFGAGFHSVLVPGKWNAKFEITYSKSDGQILFDSPIGGTLHFSPFPLGPINNLDDVTRWVVMPEVEFQARHDLSLAFGYWYDSYNIKDFQVQGFMYIPTTAQGAYNGSILMGTLPKDYNANVFYVTLTYKP